MVIMFEQNIIKLIEIAEARPDTFKKVMGKDYYIQSINGFGWRCFSYGPRWMLTKWYQDKRLALEAGEKEYVG